MKTLVAVALGMSIVASGLTGFSAGTNGPVASQQAQVYGSAICHFFPTIPLCKR